MHRVRPESAAMTHLRPTITMPAAVSTSVKASKPGAITLGCRVLWSSLSFANRQPAVQGSCPHELPWGRAGCHVTVVGLPKASCCSNPHARLLS